MLELFYVTFSADFRAETNNDKLIEQKLNCALFEFIPNFILNSILGNDLYEADKVTFQEVRVKKQDTLRDVLKLFAVQTGHATERLVSNCNR